MQKLVTVINRLQDAFSSVKLECPFDLPQIVVVGEQSSGKSSVLENFVGRDFLPRGSGIVTRRPLILQLLNSSGGEYAEFLHKPNRKYTNFNEVRQEIEMETDRLTGSQKNISNLPINMRFYSPNVLNLTVVDLPGITKVPVGDQPADIEKKIRDMILHFISNPNSIILAIIPAIVDLANSEALKLAREVDPNRLRTVGVLTKIDMMDSSTDCLAILKNSVYVLARGFVGVVNRSQQDIVNRKDLISAQKDELKFFTSHPKYNCLKDRVGTQYLQKNLNQQLSTKIKETLPKLKDAILTKFYHYQNLISQHIAVSDSENSHSQIIMILLHELVKQVDVELGYDCETVDIENVSIGSEISQILFTRFIYEVEKIKPLPDKVKTEIKIAILNSQGIRRSLFSPGASFLAVIKSHIKFIETPCNVVMDIVNSQIRKMMQQMIGRIFKSYPALSDEVQLFIFEKLQTYYKKAKDFLKIMIEIQLEHINTNHPDFLAAQDSNNESYTEKSNFCGLDSFVYRQAFLYFHNSSIFKSGRQYYGLLKGQLFFVYKDQTKSELVAQIILTDCKLRDHTGRSSRYLSITTRDGRILHKGKDCLEVSHPNSEEYEGWKAAFVSCGIELDRSEEMKIYPNEESSETDTDLKKNIEYVYILFASYLDIIIKLLQDLVSKICIFCIISKLRKSLFTDLVVHLHSVPDIENLLKESDEVMAERAHNKKMFRACKDALNAIKEIQMDSKQTDESNTKTEYEELQPPSHEFPRVESDVNVSKSAQQLPDARSVSERDLNKIRNENTFGRSENKFGAEVKKPKRPPPSSSKFISKQE